jgi:hypothetical protein
MEIYKAIIAGFATVISVIVGIYIKNHLDNKKEIKINEAIRDAVTGKWKGILSQLVEGTIENLEVELNLKVNGAAISGVGMALRNGRSIYVTLSGEFHSLRYLRIDYENRDKAILQFGTFIFQLSGDALALSGHLVGKGHLTERIINASVQLTKC